MCQPMGVGQTVDRRAFTDYTSRYTDFQVWWLEFGGEMQTFGSPVKAILSSRNVLLLIWSNRGACFVRTLSSKH